MSENKHLLGYEPINNSKQDLFNFKHYAEKVKRIIQLNSSNKEPLTIGIYGKWGEGKTSFLNLLKDKIEHFDKDKNGKEYLIFEFNPWRYSNEDEMLFDFFDGISKRFYVDHQTKIQKVGTLITRYSKYLKAIKISSSIGIPKRLGTSISFEPSKIFEALGEDLSGEQITLDKLKDKVNEAVNNANFKVLVFIDDLDRLDKDEIYTILKLIKLNANFDNFIFITTLDSEHVVKAIKDRYGEENEDGILFLEKIINIPIHLPKIETEDLQLFFEKKLDEISKNLNINESKNDEIKSIVYDFNDNYFKSPREIIKVLNSFYINAFSFEYEINLRDLFWIEYLKIKNESLYNKIKNYNGHKGVNAIFKKQSVIIDFNDMPGEGNKGFFNVENVGSRKEIIENFPQESNIFQKLFPSNIDRNFDKNTFEENLNINSVNHFDKYFSFHTVNKIESIKFEKIKQFIAEKDKDNLLNELKELFTIENSIILQKAYIKIESLIKSYRFKSESSDERNFLYSVISENLNILPNFNQDIFGIDSQNSLVELIATILNETNTDNSNQKICIEIAEKLDVNQLCHFTRKFRIEQSPFKKDLEHLIAQKAKSTFSKENPLILETRLANKMIMAFWKKSEPNTFKTHIEETLNNIDSIKKLIRQFPPFWNNKYYGGIDKSAYDYLNELVDANFIIEKIKEINIEIFDNVKSDYDFSDKDESTEDENLEQFIFWHKKLNELF